MKINHIEYGRYKHIRNAAWRLLREFGIKRLPVKLIDICRHLGIKVFTYQQNMAQLSELGIAHLCDKTEAFYYA